MKKYDQSIKKPGVVYYALFTLILSDKLLYLLI